MLKILLMNEWNKLRKSKFFYLSLLIGIIFSSIQVYNNFSLMKLIESSSVNKIHPRGFSLMLCIQWMGGDSGTFISEVFFLVIPFLAALPMGMSYCREKTNGFMNQMVFRSGTAKYIAAKGLMSFLAGMIAIAVPLIFNLMINAMFIPNVKDNVMFQMSSVMQGSFFSRLYYTNPTIYLFCGVLLISAWGGVWAFMAFTASMIITNAVVVVIFPIIFAFASNYILIYINEIFGITNYEVSPIMLMYPASGNPNPLWLEAAYIIVMMAVMILICIKYGVMNENI